MLPSLIVDHGLLELYLSQLLFKIAFLIPKELQRPIVILLLQHNLDDKFDKLDVRYEGRLLLELEENEVCDIHDFCLKTKLLGDDEHRVHGPLCVNVLVVDFVEVKALVLLFEHLAFSDVGEEELLAKVSSLAMNTECILE